jgi:hypothetical protein
MSPAWSATRSGWASSVRTNDPRRTRCRARRHLFCPRRPCLPAPLRPPAALRAAMRAGGAMQAGVAATSHAAPGGLAPLKRRVAAPQAQGAPAEPPAARAARAYPGGLPSAAPLTAGHTHAWPPRLQIRNATTRDVFQPLEKTATKFPTIGTHPSLAAPSSVISSWLSHIGFQSPPSSFLIHHSSFLIRHSTFGIRHFPPPPSRNTSRGLLAGLLRSFTTCV